MRLKELNGLTIQNYEALMVVYSAKEELSPSVTLFQDFQLSGLPVSGFLYSTFLLNLVERSKKSGITAAKESYFSLKRFYRAKDALNIKNTRLFMDICTLYCKFEDDQAAIILADMIAANHEPVPELCTDLLSEALFHKDIRVLRILMGWYNNHISFGAVRLSFGQLSRLLEISSGMGDTLLATIALQQLEKNAYPLQGHHFYSLIQSFKANEDFSNAVEAVVEMERKEILLSHVSTTNQKCGTEIRNSLVRMLIADSNSISSVDAFYSALMDHLHDGEMVPSLLLQTLLHALGKTGHRDRAIAAFERIISEFDIKLSVDLYNALMAGCSDSPTAVIQIFNDLCAKSNQGEVDDPNEETYSILCETLLHSPKHHEFIRKLAPNCLPNLRTVRRLVALDSPLSSEMTDVLTARSRSRVDLEFSRFIKERTIEEQR